MLADPLGLSREERDEFLCHESIPEERGLRRTRSVLRDAGTTNHGSKSIESVPHSAALRVPNCRTTLLPHGSSQGWQFLSYPTQTSTTTLSLRTHCFSRGRNCLCSIIPPFQTHRTCHWSEKHIRRLAFSFSVHSRPIEIWNQRMFSSSKTDTSNWRISDCVSKISISSLEQRPSVARRSTSRTKFTSGVNMTSMSIGGRWVWWSSSFSPLSRPSTTKMKCKSKITCCTKTFAIQRRCLAQRNNWSPVYWSAILNAAWVIEVHHRASSRSNRFSGTQIRKNAFKENIASI